MRTKRTFLFALALGIWLTLPHPATAQFTLLNIGHTNDSNPNLNIAAVGVAVSGNYACLANYNGSLYVYNVSDPANPRNVGRTNDGGYARAVALAGNYAYLCTSSGLLVYDLSDPAQPANVGSTNVGYGDRYRIHLSGNDAYTVGEYDGLRTYDVSDPTHPLSVSRIPGPSVSGVAISGNYAYLAGSFPIDGNPHSLRIYDLSNPASPVFVGRTTNQIMAADIALSGNYALVLSRSQYGLWVYDVSDPHTPLTVLHTNWLTVSQNTIVILGNYAYTAAPFLQMYDISNPLTPFKVGQSSQGPFLPQDIAVAGNYLYAATGTDGLRTYLIVPQLGIAPTATNTIVLSWPQPPAPGFVLQSSSDLTSANWSEVTNTPAVADNRNVVVLPTPGASQFYRLRWP